MPPWKESTEAMLTMRPSRLAASAFLRKGLAEEEQRLEVDVHDVVPVLFGKIGGVGAADDAGIVDQPVDRPAASQTPSSIGACGDMVAEVAGDRREHGALGLHQRLGLVHRGAADADHRAAGLGDGDADALA